MRKFLSDSKEYLREKAQAAAWMMRRNVGIYHWWRPESLTGHNGDADKKRPNLHPDRAKQIFDDLIDLGLLVQRADDVDGNGVPAYTMKYDIRGWDQVVADGMPLISLWLQVKRAWIFMLITFLFGCVVTTIENRITGVLDGIIGHAIGEKKQDVK